MPILPIQDLDATYPSRSGTPRGTQDVPVVPNQPGSLAASQTLGTAIAGLGTSVLQANELAQQRQAIEERKRQADELIAATLTKNKQTLALQDAADEEDQNPDYATLATRVEARGKQLIADGAQGMSPRGRALYESQMYETLSVFKQRAVTEQSKRRDEMSVFAMEGERAHAQQAMIEAKTPQEYDVAFGQFQETTRRMVQAGLARGGPAAESIRKTVETVSIQRTERANRVNPRQMETHLRALMDGKDGLPGLPVPPTQELPRLYDDAQKEVHEANVMEHRGDVQAEKDVRLAQDNLEMELTNELYAIAQSEHPTVEAVTAVQRKITGAAAFQGPGLPAMISKEGQTRLLHQAQSLHDGLLKPKVIVEDETVKRRLKVGSLMASPQWPYPLDDEITAAENKGQIKPETGMEIRRERVKLQDEAHMSKIPEVQTAKTRIRQRLTSVLGLFPMPGEKSVGMDKYLEADTLFDTIIQQEQDKVRSPQEKVAIARQWAGLLEDQILRSYTPLIKAYAQNGIPKIPMGIEEVFLKEGITEAVNRVNALGVPLEQRETYLLNLLRRQELNWLSGEPIDPATVPEPRSSTWEWVEKIKGAFSRNKTGTPIPQP